MMTLPQKNSLKYHFLRFALLLGFCGWSISFLFTLTSWSFSSNILYGLGADEIVYQPLLDYWLKMASAVFGAIGIFFLLPLFNREKYKVLVPILGWFSFFVGIVLIFAAFGNSLNPKVHVAFIPDITFCFVTGSLILFSIFNNSSTE